MGELASSYFDKKGVDEVGVDGVYEIGRACGLGSHSLVAIISLGCL